MTKHQDRQPRKQQQKRPQFFHRNDQRVRLLHLAVAVHNAPLGNGSQLWGKYRPSAGCPYLTRQLGTVVLASYLKHLPWVLTVCGGSVQQVVHSSSVDIRPEWAVVEQIPFTSLSKLNYQVSTLSLLLQQGQAATGYETS